MFILLPMVTDHKQLWLYLPADGNSLGRWEVFYSTQLHLQPLTHRQRAGIVPDLSSNRPNKNGCKTLFLFSLNINTTVDSIMRDHGMEKDSHCRSESKAGSLAASCSQAEKRLLNNNILINAPLPFSVATGSTRRREHWELEAEQGHLSLSASAVWRGGFEETLWVLRPSWSPSQ